MNELASLLDDIYDDIGAELFDNTLVLGVLIKKAHNIYSGLEVELTKDGLVELLVVYNKIRAWADDASLYNELNMLVLDLLSIL